MKGGCLAVGKQLRRFVVCLLARVVGASRGFVARRNSAQRHHVSSVWIHQTANTAKPHVKMAIPPRCFLYPTCGELLETPTCNSRTCGCPACGTQSTSGRPRTTRLPCGAAADIALATMSPTASFDALRIFPDIPSPQAT